MTEEDSKQNINVGEEEKKTDKDITNSQEQQGEQQVEENEADQPGPGANEQPIGQSEDQPVIENAEQPGQEAQENPVIQPENNQQPGQENQQEQPQEQQPANENQQEPNQEAQQGEPQQVQPEQQQPKKAEGELIYSNEADVQEMGKLFDDENEKEEYDTYEIEFRVNDSKKNPITVLVELEKIKYKKPYYGGFVNKTNGTYYYHAYAQTDQFKNEHIIKNEREAQTYEYRTLSTKMHREFGTQMSYVGLYIDKRQDKEIKPKKYFDSDQWKAKKEYTVKYLQKMMRGFFARKTCKELRKERDDEKMEIERKEEEKRQQQEKKNKVEIKRRMHPKTANDFKLLKKELDEWVQSETIRIKSSDLSSEDKSLALQELLHKEISLLQTIEKLKIAANKENRTEQISKFLEKMSRDKKWKGYDGHHVNVQTVLTATAAGLEKQFKKLIASTTVDVRLANLLEFKKMMTKSNEDHPCSLIQKIIDLIEREVDMLHRGRPDSSLEGLRQRLNNLYLSYIEAPSFNPEAQRFQIIPKDYLLNMYKNKSD